MKRKAHTWFMAEVAELWRPDKVWEKLFKRIHRG